MTSVLSLMVLILSDGTEDRASLRTIQRQLPDGSSSHWRYDDKVSNITTDRRDADDQAQSA